MNDVWNAIPEYPKNYRHLVKTAYYAWHHPLYVGAFRDNAFPDWWINLRKWIEHNYVPYLTLFYVSITFYLFHLILVSL